MYTVELEKEELEKNFLMDRVRKINQQIDNIRDKNNIVVWGAGTHTDYLFKYTDVLKYKITVVDNRKSGAYFAFEVISPKNVDWKKVTAVIISGRQSVADIICELKSHYGYKGEIIEFYEPGEIWSFWQLNKNKKSCFWGDFTSFQEAVQVAGIWNESETFEQELKVLRNVLQEPQNWYWSQWIQKNLLRIYMENQQKHLCVIDFGGGFGQEYFNDKNILEDMQEVKWIVVDQQKHVTYGKEHLQTEKLIFSECLEEAAELAEGKCSLLIFGSVLQYIDKWEDFLQEALNMDISYMLINRQHMAKRERICIQNMGAYNSMSAYRIFDERELLDSVSAKYQLLDQIKYSECGDIFYDLLVEEKCWLFRRKDIG